LIFESSSSITSPYVGRSPIELASRYDPQWLTSSRGCRIADPLWKDLLNQMKEYCDADTALTGDLRARESTMEPEIRDAVDAERIQNCLRQLPLPRRVSDLKNHPLYVLQRHLLKFEIIHPPDAPVIGFLKVGKTDSMGEPIFSRDYLHICHTREAWLKEAKNAQIAARWAVKAIWPSKASQGRDPSSHTRVLLWCRDSYRQYSFEARHIYPVL
uniref:BHD_1 domain-containing protein n=1 Tax=Schistocephalus solidus TaxID=70667 RepID=A0A183TUF4_SCHSO